MMPTKKGLLTGAAVVVALAATTTSQAALLDFKFGRNAAERPAAAGEQVAQAADADRLNRIEAQIRTLTGQIEELSNQLRQLQDQLQRTQADTDYRLGNLEGAGAGTQPQQPTFVQPPPALNPPVGNQRVELLGHEPATAHHVGIGRPARHAALVRS